MKRRIVSGVGIINYQDYGVENKESTAHLDVLQQGSIAMLYSSLYSQSRLLFSALRFLTFCIAISIQIM